jgi:hypothetical protein
MTTKLDPGKVSTQLDYIQRDITMLRSNDIKDIKATLKEVADKQDAQDNRITSLETKVGVIGTISIAFTTIAASIAAWIGVKS